MVRKKLRSSECFSLLRNRSEQSSEHFIFRGIFRVPRNIFFSENGKHIPNSLLTHVQIFNDDTSSYLFPSWLNFFPFSYIIRRVPLATSIWPLPPGRVPLAASLWQSPPAAYPLPRPSCRVPLAASLWPRLWPRSYGRVPLAVSPRPRPSGQVPMSTSL
jgi:hypothetical protein